MAPGAVWDLVIDHFLHHHFFLLSFYYISCFLSLVLLTHVSIHYNIWPTKTVLTCYKVDDSPPSIRIKVGVGSASYEPSGVMAVLPGSTIHLDCMYPRRRGSPEWTWTGWFRQYLTGK